MEEHIYGVVQKTKDELWRETDKRKETHLQDVCEENVNFKEEEAITLCTTKRRSMDRKKTAEHCLMELRTNMDNSSQMKC